jgi:hypothetical protein
MIGFIGLLYNLLLQFRNHNLTHCVFSIILYCSLWNSGTQLSTPPLNGLNSPVAPVCLQDNSSAWTMQKTQPLLLRRHVHCALHGNGHGVAHIERRSSIVACVLQTLSDSDYCLLSHCLATGLYVTLPLP